jgi:hypothetical protein
MIQKDKGMIDVQGVAYPPGDKQAAVFGGISGNPMLRG